MKDECVPTESNQSADSWPAWQQGLYDSKDNKLFLLKNRSVLSEGLHVERLLDGIDVTLRKKLA